MFSLLNCQAWLLHIHLWTAINADSSKKNYKKLQKRAWVSVFHLVRYTSLRFKNTNDERYSQRDNLVLQVGKTRILPWHQLSWPEPSSYIRWGILKKKTPGSTWTTALKDIGQRKTVVGIRNPKVPVTILTASGQITIILGMRMRISTSVTHRLGVLEDPQISEDPTFQDLRQPRQSSSNKFLCIVHYSFNTVVEDDRRGRSGLRR